MATEPAAAHRDASRSARAQRALLRAARAGSEEAIEELFRRHWPRAHRAAYLIVHDAAAAEDIAQEGFLAALRALDRFDRRRPFGPWLHRIVVNRSIDWARRRAIRLEVSQDTAIEAAGERSSTVPAPDLPSEEMMDALADLPVDQRAAVVLRYLLDFTPGEIGRLLGLPRGTVNSRLRRGLDRLAELLPEESR
jgi:RNA polymerase sigma-70 factor, ECF subfamily